MIGSDGSYSDTSSSVEESESDSEASNESGDSPKHEEVIDELIVRLMTAPLKPDTNVKSNGKKR